MLNQRKQHWKIFLSLMTMALSIGLLIPSALAGGGDLKTTASATVLQHTCPQKPFVMPTTGTVVRDFEAGHFGLDIRNITGTAVVAAGGGTVSKVSVNTWGGGYGNYVLINHGNGLTTLYAHLNDVSAEEGDIVMQGQLIGHIGTTGNVKARKQGAHLHFEVHKDQIKQAPYCYIN